MALVYIIEDDEDINELLVYNLEKEGFKVKSFYNSIDALKRIREKKPDILLLDIMLPDIDGLEFCKILKSDEELSDIPIIMLTAKSTEIDKIVGLELGADDYITKPFSMRELIARIRAVLRRHKRYSSKKREEISIGDLNIDTESLEVKVSGKRINLTSKEFKLLMFLIKNAYKVLSREEILNNVWENEYDVYDRTVDVHIRHLREKLGKYKECIKTIRGIGYKWECGNSHL